MKQALIVAVREFNVTLRRPSFYAAVLLAPLIVGAIFFGLTIVGDEFNDEAQRDFASASSKPVGFVDQAGVVANVPMPFDQFIRPFADEATAGAAVRDGTIGSYFVVAPDYLQSGRVVRVSQQATMTGGSGSDTRAFEALLRINLSGDALLAERIGQPLDLDVTIVGEQQAGAPQTNNPVAGLSYSLALLLAFSIVSGGSWLVQAIAEEKENRTVEIVLTSMQPLQLMLGKLLGLSAVALLQFGIWMFIARTVFGTGLVSQINVSEIAPSVWLWTILFFILGFLFFGSIMLAIGAVGASMRESGQITGFMTMPIFVPLWFAAPIIENPDSTLAVVLSMLPPTAPVTMMLRLGQGFVPLWQLLASVLILAAAVAGGVWVAARLFRGSTLLTGAKPTPRVIWRAIRSGS